MSRSSSRHGAAWGWQALWCRLGNGAGGDEGSVQAEIQKGIFTNKACAETTGEQKTKAWAAGVVSYMSNSVGRDNVMGGDGLKANRALALERTMMTAESGGVVIRGPGVGMIRGVLLAAYKVGASICTGFER